MLKITPLGLNGLPLVLNHQGGFTARVDGAECIFPIKYRNKVLMIIPKKEEGWYDAYATNISVTKFTIKSASQDANNARWVAFGY